MVTRNWIARAEAPLWTAPACRLCSASTNFHRCLRATIKVSCRFLTTVSFRTATGARSSFTPGSRIASIPGVRRMEERNHSDTELAAITNYRSRSNRKMPSSPRNLQPMMAKLRCLPLLVICLLFFSIRTHAQDWVKTGTNLGNSAIRLAAADFKPGSADPQTPALKTVFDATLFNDLSNAGIFDMVSKSMAPQATPGSPQEMNLGQWSADPANAA